MLTKIQGKSHPKHYLMHKYWGRKAHNLVAEYIQFYTSPGDTVLDPFMGSGGVVIESKKKGRKSIGVDINPITKLIVDNTLNDIDLEYFQSKHKEIIDSIPEEVKQLAMTKCPVCKKSVTLENAIWVGDKITKVKGYCPQHKRFVKNAGVYDKSQAALGTKLLKKYSGSKSFYYPTDRILDFVRRNGKKNIDELFSDRNLLLAASILRNINKVQNEQARCLYQMAFTSMLPNISSMIPANEHTATGKSGWQISKFWVPNTHTEKNALTSFESRVNVVYKGKLETQGLFTDVPYKIKIQSAEDLGFIPDNHIDYIFTDPPYGDSIAYLGLSMFWNSWLRYPVNYDQEIIHDLYRKKGDSDYKARLSTVFLELYRVLKPGKKLSFTFHNRYLKFWKIVIDAVQEAGFELEDITWHSQAVNSGTQGINRKNTLKGDFIYTFRKPLKYSKPTALKPAVPGETLLIDEVSKLFKKCQFIETARLYEEIIPVIVRERAFLNKKGNVLNIDKVLATKFYYKEVNSDSKRIYGWAKT